MVEDRPWLSWCIWIEPTLYSVDPLKDKHEFIENISKILLYQRRHCRHVSSAHSMVSPLKFLAAFYCGWALNAGSLARQIPGLRSCELGLRWISCFLKCAGGRGRAFGIPASILNRLKLEHGRAAPVWHPLQWVVYCEDICACLGFSCAGLWCWRWHPGLHAYSSRALLLDYTLTLVVGFKEVLIA